MGLEPEIEEKLKEDENTIKIETDKVEEKPKRKSVKSASVKFDDEISRLCNLGALKNLIKKRSRSKPAKADKKSKMKNGKKSLADYDIESLSSGDELEEISSRKKSPGKPLPKSKSAKDAVLGSSESDLSENENKSSVKKKDKKAKKE